MRRETTMQHIRGHRNIVTVSVLPFPFRGDADATISRTNTERLPSTMTSTAREAAMLGTGISEAAAKASAAETRALSQNPLLAPPAGGPGGRITDRGRKVVGISGEVRGGRGSCLSPFVDKWIIPFVYSGVPHFKLHRLNEACTSSLSFFYASEGLSPRRRS